MNIVLSPYSAVLAVMGALLGLLADWLSRRFGTGKPGTGRRRLISAGILALFAAGYGTLLEIRWPELFASVNCFEGGYPLLAVHLFAVFVLFTATLTDFDDYMIPDALMIPATVSGLILMTFFPASLPAWRTVWAGPGGLVPAVVEGPLCGLDLSEPLSRCGFCLTASALWIFWCLALLDRRWYLKLGFSRAGTLFLRHLRRSPLTPILAVLAVLGVVLVGVMTSRMPEFVEPGTAPERLLTALIGMAAGMGMIWIVRIAGRLTLGREAMGFGDVVLMGFIGLITGWQGAIIVFFLAPFAGLLFGLIRALFRTEREIPYGPFLCLATAALWLFWPALWEFTEPVLSDGGAVLFLAAIAAVLLVFLLGGIRLLKSFIFR